MTTYAPNTLVFVTSHLFTVMSQSGEWVTGYFGRPRPDGSHPTTQTVNVDQITHAVRTIPLHTLPGWVIRFNETTQQYWADNTRGIGIGPGESTLEAAMYFAKHGEPPIHA